MSDRNPSKRKPKSHGQKSVGHRPKFADGLPTTLSKQQRYRIRKRLAGLCIHCGNPRKTYSYRCDPCQAKVRERQRVSA